MRERDVFRQVKALLTDTALIERISADGGPSRWGHHIAAVWRRIWAGLNRERFTPL